MVRYAGEVKPLGFMVLTDVAGSSFFWRMEFAEDLEFRWTLLRVKGVVDM
jgi:hypothetical protein